MKRFVFLFAVAAALCFGQALDDFAWWDSPIAQNLNLTPEQQKQIRGTVREFRDRLIEQRAGVQKAEAGFMDFLNDDQVNEAKAKEAIDKLVVARGDLMRSVSQMSLRLRAVLTPQQWQDVQRRRAQQRPQGPQGRGALAPGAQQRLRQRGAMGPDQRAQIQQRLRQIDKRLNQAEDLTPAERQQLLDQLRQIQQTLQAGGAPAQGPGPNPQRRGPAPPPPGGQPF
jgi:Spy/CpxP family protein refolding chaperone